MDKARKEEIKQLLHSMMADAVYMQTLMLDIGIYNRFASLASKRIVSNAKEIEDAVVGMDAVEVRRKHGEAVAARAEKNIPWEREIK
jgi:hypothetical protein|tara:strand:+ start:413 stop:673 length:261 start_codon:yes stop_codon:yes gene_type:complete